MNGGTSRACGRDVDVLLISLKTNCTIALD